MIYLAKALKTFLCRMDRLDRLVEEAEVKAERRERDIRYSVYTVEVQTAFARLARSAYLAGATQGTTASGIKLRAQLYPDVPRALTAAAQLFKRGPTQVPGRDEPSWQSFHCLARIAQSIRVANTVDFQVATSMFPQTGTVLTSVRNFYAHRCHHTYETVRHVFRETYGVSLHSHLSDVLATVVSGRAVPLPREWSGHYRSIAEMLCGYSC